MTDDSDSESERDLPRHYDIECEAAESIAGILATKIKSLQIKVLYEIKSHQKNQPSKFRQHFVKQKYGQKLGVFTPRASRINQTLKPFASMAQLSFSPVTQSHENASPKNLNKSLSELMIKVRQLNSRIRPQNSSAGSFNPEADKCDFTKMQKRKNILAKISQIEQDIEEMMQEDETGIQSSTSLGREEHALRANANN